MASAFWTLEDGRGFARRWSWMAEMLARITDELKEIKGAEAFYAYLQEFVYSEERGDVYNGFGGFIRDDENIMFNFDLRTFAPQNRQYFWQATQNALTKLKIQSPNDEGLITLFTILLDIHKRIKKGEAPNLLTDMRTVEPPPSERIGPGW